MPKVTLKVTRWLFETLNAEPPDSEEICISVPHEETIAGMVRGLATQRDAFWNAMLDEKTQEIGANVLVVLNGCIVNPSVRSEATLQDGDEVTFLPAFAGG